MYSILTDPVEMQEFMDIQMLLTNTVSLDLINNIKTK